MVNSPENEDGFMIDEQAEPESAAHILRDMLNSFEMRFSRAENLAQVARMRELAQLACDEIDAYDYERNDPANQ